MQCNNRRSGKIKALQNKSLVSSFNLYLFISSTPRHRTRLRSPVYQAGLLLSAVCQYPSRGASLWCYPRAFHQRHIDNDDDARRRGVVFFSSLCRSSSDHSVACRRRRKKLIDSYWKTSVGRRGENIAAVSGMARRKGKAEARRAPQMKTTKEMLIMQMKSPPPTPPLTPSQRHR